MKYLSPAIKVASAFTMGGAASAVANILLARSLTTHQFGEFSLVLAIAVFSVPLGPLSLDAVVLRHRPGPQMSLLRMSLISGIIGGALVAMLAAYFYQIDSGFLPFIALIIAAGSVAKVGASVYQSVEKYRWSLWLIQSQNITLIVFAIAAGTVVGVSATTVFSAYAVHWIVAAFVAWISLCMFSQIELKPLWQAPWRERAPLFGHLVTVQLFAALDRLMIPKLLDIESLATFGVLAVLVIAPFKMFEIAMGYTLIPGLRNAPTLEVRSKILMHEIRTSSFVIVLAILSGFLVAPWAKEILLHDKYQLSTSLIAAAVLAGSLKVGAMFASSIVTALGNHRQLGRLNLGSWFALSMSVAGAWFGSQWGLPGLVLGFATGSAVRIVIAALIAIQVWAEPDTENTPTIAQA